MTGDSVLLEPGRVRIGGTRSVLLAPKKELEKGGTKVYFWRPKVPKSE